MKVSGTFMRVAPFLQAFLLISLFTTSFLVDAALADSAPIKDNPNRTIRYMGVGSCASSNCHGSATQRSVSPVLQNEYVTWQRHDAHSQAYLTLFSESSKVMASHLGIKKAHESELCLSCHATYVPDTAMQGDKFRIEDGVGCESCHGPSSSWLKAHTEHGSSHARNKELGLFELVDPANRAALCATCHVGGADRNVDHRLIGAGHPRLSFELDTFSELLPRHWEVDDDYIERKGSYSPAKAWIVGQAVLAGLTLQRWRTTHRTANVFEYDFSKFYCYTCHHSLIEQQWKERDYAGRPGTLRLNLSHLTVLKESLLVLDRSMHQRITGYFEALNRPTDLSLKILENTETFLLEDLTPHLQGLVINTEDANKILKQLVTYASNQNAPPYEVAEQLAMAISALASELNQAGNLRGEIEKIYASLKDPAHFKPAAFQEAAGRMLRRL